MPIALAHVCSEGEERKWRGKKPVYAPYREHVPPDTTAAIFWLKNRDPARWRDAWQMEHTLGKYLISDKPMSEEDWAKERATLIDVTSEEDKLALPIERLGSTSAHRSAAFAGLYTR